MSYQSFQKAAITLMGLKEGDQVRVTRKPQTFEMGWEYITDDRIDTMVGKTYTVDRIYNGSIKINGVYLAVFVLEKTADGPVKEKKDFSDLVSFMANDYWASYASDIAYRARGQLYIVPTSYNNWVTIS